MISKNQLKKLIQAGNSDLEIATQLSISQREIFSARKNYNLLTDKEKTAISKTRRKLIRGGIITLALTGVGGTMGGIIYQLARPVTYEDAVNDEKRRQTHIDRIVQGKIPDYIIFVKYATNDLLEKLAKHGYAPSKDTYADTIPVVMSRQGDFEPASAEHIGKGVKSIVLVYKSVYNDLYNKYPPLKRTHPEKELYNDFEVIIRNVLLKNEFTDARNFNQGLTNYPIESFKDSKGMVNHRLFNIVIDLLSNSEEYKGVIADPRTSKSKYLRYYANGLQQMISGQHSLLFNPQLTHNMDANVIQRLQNDFHPNKLLN